MYDKGSSVNKDAELSVVDEIFLIKTQNFTVFEEHISELSISPRIGNIERKITLKNGCVFATKENNEIDKILKKTKNNNVIHFLESNYILIFFSLIFTIVFAVSFLKWGVPYLSKNIAYAMPSKTNNLISENALKTFDKYILNPSELTNLQKSNIRYSFSTKILPFFDKKDRGKYKIHFRLWKNGNESIANAFALPNGDIIITDKLVHFSKNLDEINSILLHEIGHVEKRHGLRSIIENSFIVIGLMFISGDSTALGDMGVGMGSLFLNSNYSRDHEMQADLFAFKKMLIVKIDPKNFINILSRIIQNESKNKNGEVKFMNYLSSHPNISERIFVAKQYEKCFNEGLSDCGENK